MVLISPQSRNTPCDRMAFRLVDENWSNAIGRRAELFFLPATKLVTAATT